MAYDATDFTPVRPLDRDPKSLTDPRERLEYLRDFLRELPAERFDMNWFASAPGRQDDDISAERVRTDCGTVACIAGWCQALFSDRKAITGSGDAKELLGLTGAQSSPLFYANSDREDGVTTYWDATPTQAANVLDHLLKTGEVDWSVA